MNTNSNDEKLWEFETSDKESVIATIQGDDLDIRTWRKDLGSKRYFRTQLGCTIPLDQISDLADCFTHATHSEGYFQLELPSSSRGRNIIEFGCIEIEEATVSLTQGVMDEDGDWLDNEGERPLWIPIRAVPLLVAALSDYGGSH
jgi:hypothetical protein